MTAMQSISTDTSRGSRAAWTVERDGGAGLEEFRVNGIHLGEIVHIPQKHSRSHDVFNRSARGTYDRYQVLQNALRLGLDAAVLDQLTRRWIDRNLARNEQEIPSSNGLRIGTNCRRSFSSRNDDFVIHGLPKRRRNHKMHNCLASVLLVLSVVSFPCPLKFIYRAVFTVRLERVTS